MVLSLGHLKEIGPFTEGLGGLGGGGLTKVVQMEPHLGVRKLNDKIIILKAFVAGGTVLSWRESKLIAVKHPSGGDIMTR